MTHWVLIIIQTQNMKGLYYLEQYLKTFVFVSVTTLFILGAFPPLWVTRRSLTVTRTDLRHPKCNWFEETICPGACSQESPRVSSSSWNNQESAVIRNIIFELRYHCSAVVSLIIKSHSVFSVYTSDPVFELSPANHANMFALLAESGSDWPEPQCNSVR